ncbi:MAG: DNA translocase FtsK 4TM domain-containing protein, partial [Candidatus Omnitrophica bacterium]|nr:DNA translocase FtsK 4TM domain-containing protein [Candidatus Omnitrophota bacterium]
MDQRRKNEIIAVVLFAVSLFMFLSIFTFREQDISFYTSSPNAVPHNGTGIIGSYLGALLLFFMGKASYVIPCLLMVWGVMRLLQMQEHKIFFKLFGTVVLVSAVSASLSMVSGAGRVLSFSNGGLLGSVSADFLLGYLGPVGAAVFVAATMILSMLVATEFMLLPLILSAFKLARRTVTEIKESLPEKIEAPAITGRNKKVDKVKALKAREEVARKLAEMKKQVDETRRTSFSRRAGEDKEERSPHTAEKRPAGRTEPKIVSAPPAKKSAAGAERITAVNAGGQKIDYKIPGTDMLHTPLKDKDKDQEREEDLKLKAEILEKTLLTFDVEAKVVKINRGPIITLYELEPSLGTKVGRITSLEDEISLAMRSSNIRIIAPLPGKGTIGIEIPNDKREVVLIRDILETREYTEEESPLKFALGKGISGEPLIADLSKMPHLLIAGTTGSGKTVCLNSVISSLL